MKQEDFFDFIERDYDLDKKVNVLDGLRESSAAMSEAMFRLKINANMCDFEEIALLCHDVQNRLEMINKVSQAKAMDLAKWDLTNG